MLIGKLFFWPLCLCTLIARLPITASDDMYVYFNYARQFAHGNYFAYDVRGIPSEGVTSIVYLWLLVPFELLGCNPLFGAVVINLAFVLLTSWAVARACKHNVPGGKETAELAAACFAFFWLSDTNVQTVLGLGFESIGATAFLILFVNEVARGDSSGRRKCIRCLLIGAICCLFRPEASAGVLLLCSGLYATSEDRKSLRVPIAVAVVALAAFLFGKWLLFGDFFPTAYYRKVSPSGLPGYSYVTEFLSYYKLRLIFALMSLLLIYIPNGKTDLSAFRRFAAATLFLSLSMALVVLKTLPIVAYNFRFLFFPMSALLFLPVMSLCALADGFAKKWNRLMPWSAGVVYLMLIVAVVGGSTGGNTFNLYARSVISFRNHPYFQIGSILNRRVTNHKKFTIAFGDAGIVPYLFDGIFIDLNGLTEPPLARLNRIPDLNLRASLFSNYVINYRPDLLVLSGGFPKHDGLLEIQHNPHSPLSRNQYFFAKSLYDDGYRYLCSFRFKTYDLHFSINPKSRLHSEALEVASELCDPSHSYVLPSLKESFSGRVVEFAPYPFPNRALD